MRKKAIVIGSGAGGAMAAKELQKHFDVTVLEAGHEFKPLSYNINLLEKMRKTGLFLDERMIQLLFPSMKIRKPTKDYVIVNGICLGGTTTLSAGNGVRVDDHLQALGINLDCEFEELYTEIPITTAHTQGWSKLTKELFSTCREMDLNPKVTPKMMDNKRCTVCGQCVLGCKTGAKWDSRLLLKEADKNGAKIITKCRVEKLEIENNQVTRILVTERGRKKYYQADIVVLAAGGLETPVILKRSGIDCEPTLFVDPVLCVAAPLKGAKLNHQIPMPFIVEHENYIISPYFDYLSFFFNNEWKSNKENIISMMIKLADDSIGSSDDKGIQKELSTTDRSNLEEAVAICSDILIRSGIKKEEIFLGTINAGHPGGMLPLTTNEKETFHNEKLPVNLYVSDASLFPKSLGRPPILTIMALAKRISKLCIKQF